uniref:Chromodomain-helicase-DNA-binding protein 6-9 tri-helical domain-containing protein n=1 Tax=Glossina austeni TaxID=7395 RepID=A0A1A9VL86_GLOAU
MNSTSETTSTHTTTLAPDWTKFKQIAHLERKSDENLSNYYKDFAATCKRQAEAKLNENEKGLKGIIDDINEDHANANAISLTSQKSSPATDLPLGGNVVPLPSIKGKIIILDDELLTKSNLIEIENYTTQKTDIKKESLEIKGELMDRKELHDEVQESQLLKVLKKKSTKKGDKSYKDFYKNDEEEISDHLESDDPIKVEIEKQHLKRPSEHDKNVLKDEGNPNQIKPEQTKQMESYTDLGSSLDFKKLKGKKIGIEMAYVEENSETEKSIEDLCGQVVQMKTSCEQQSSCKTITKVENKMNREERQNGVNENIVQEKPEEDNISSLNDEALDLFRETGTWPVDRDDSAVAGCKTIELDKDLHEIIPHLREGTGEKVYDN